MLGCDDRLQDLTEKMQHKGSVTRKLGMVRKQRAALQDKVNDLKLQYQREAKDVADRTICDGAFMAQFCSFNEKPRRIPSNHLQAVRNVCYTYCMKFTVQNKGNAYENCSHWCRGDGDALCGLSE